MVQGMTRLPDWRVRLHAVLNPQYDQQFVWGKNDCVIGLALAAVEALTGADIRASLPAYGTEREALKALRQLGFKGLPEAVASYLPEITPFQARSGDLGLLKTSGLIGYALGVVCSSSVVVLTSTGVGHKPLKKIVKAYRVG